MTKEDMNLTKPSAHFAKQQYRQQEQFFASCDDAVAGHRGQAVRLMPANCAAFKRGAIIGGIDCPQEILPNRKEFP